MHSLSADLDEEYLIGKFSGSSHSYAPFYRHSKIVTTWLIYEQKDARYFTPSIRLLGCIVRCTDLHSACNIIYVYYVIVIEGRAFMRRCRSEINTYAIVLISSIIIAWKMVSTVEIRNSRTYLKVKYYVILKNTEISRMIGI